MASRNVRVNSTQQEEVFDPAERIQQSNTLKRHPKMDLNKTDLLRLLSYLEGELQARDVVIATLKAEKAKQLLYQAKYGRFGLGDPFVALQRDSDNMKDNSFDETAIKCMYDNQLAQLENLIATQRKAQVKMREQLAQVEKRYHKVLSELEDEKQKHAQDTAQGDDVTYMLEKERERLKQEVEFEKTQNRRMEKDLKKTLASLEEERANSAKHKQVALMLIRERRKLVERILQEKHKCNEMEHVLNDEKDKMLNMAEGLVQESRKSLKMEAAMEKQLSEFDTEREQLRSRVIREENKSKELQSEADSLRQQVDELHRKLTNSQNVKDFEEKNTATAFSSCPSSREPSADRTVLVAPSASSFTKTVHIPPSSVVLDNSSTSSPIDAKKCTVQFNSHHSPSSPEKRPISPGEMFSPASDVRIISEGSSGNRISLSAGGTTVVSTSGGKISFQIGQSSGPTRKSVSIGRGTPPPIPPNKPVLVASGGSGKPAVPPKVGITVSKERLTVSGSESDSSSSGSNQPKSVQIPVSVVTSQSNVPSSRTAKESSPLRKTTQSVEFASSPPSSPSSTASPPLPPPPPPPSLPQSLSLSGQVSEYECDSMPLSPSLFSPSADSMEFLDQEMAQLQQVLVSMAAGKQTNKKRKTQQTVHFKQMCLFLKI